MVFRVAVGRAMVCHEYGLSGLIVSSTLIERDGVFASGRKKHCPRRSLGMVHYITLIKNLAPEYARSLISIMWADRTKVNSGFMALGVNPQS